MTLVFWIAAAFVLYVYAAYPVLLAVWAALRPAAGRRTRELGDGTAASAPALPRVSIVLAARNEGRRLPGRLANLLALDYPKALREVIVVSDGSTDETEAVLRAYAADVRSVILPARGKAAALNAGVEAARHDIIVFGDARQRFATDALGHLVQPFSDPAVAGVSGELMIDADAAASDSSVAEGVGLYWRYEKWLRQRESDVGSMLGATGAIWALRRSAWQPLPPETVLDDVLAPMRAVLAGHRVVFAPRARAYDRSSADAATERRRKVRTLAGNFQLLRLEPRLLVPGVNPVWFQFVSHKMGRLLVPYALVALFVASAVLAPTSAVYGAALTLQVAFYVLAAHGAVIALAREHERDAGAAGGRGAAWDPALSGLDTREGVRE